MFTTYVIVTVLAAVASSYSALAGFFRAGWILDNMSQYGVPHSWLPTLGALKLAGAVGLLVGIGVRWIGAAAAIGLILFFLGALVAVLRARRYLHAAFPLPFLLLAAGSLLLGLMATS